jgi:hypothetical protein
VADHQGGQHQGGMKPAESGCPESILPIVVMDSPMIERLGALLGHASKYPACEAFGRSPGLAG